MAHAFGFSAPRQKAAPFGANAPQQATIKEGGVVSFGEWKLTAKDFATTDSAKQIYLDQSYDQVHPGDYTVVERDADNAPASFQTLKVSAGGVSKVLRADYGLTGPSTKLTLDRKWHEEAFDGTTGLDVLRRVSVYIQPEELTLAEEPIPDDHNIPDDRTELFDGETADTSDLRPSRIALDDYYPELETGRLLIVSGDRADLPNTSGAAGRRADGAARRPAPHGRRVRARRPHRRPSVYGAPTRFQIDLCLYT